MSSISRILELVCCPECKVKVTTDNVLGIWEGTRAHLPGLQQGLSPKGEHAAFAARPARTGGIEEMEPRQL